MTPPKNAIVFQIQTLFSVQIDCVSIPPEIPSVTTAYCIVHTKTMQVKDRRLEIGILAALLLAGAMGIRARGNRSGRMATLRPSGKGGAFKL